MRLRATRQYLPYLFTHLGRLGWTVMFDFLSHKSLIGDVLYMSDTLLWVWKMSKCTKFCYCGIFHSQIKTDGSQIKNIRHEWGLMGHTISYRFVWKKHLHWLKGVYAMVKQAVEASSEDYIPWGTQEGHSGCDSHQGRWAQSTVCVSGHY